MNRPTANFDDVTIPQEEDVEVSEEKEEENPEPEQEEPEDEHVTTEEGPTHRQFSQIVMEGLQNAINFLSKRESRIVAIGDSLTQGVGAYNEEGGYVGILDRAINENNQIVTIDNFGKRGNRSVQLLERLNDPGISSSLAQADITLITIGANDIMKIVKENFTNLKLEDFDQGRRQFEERLKEIITTIQDINPKSEIYLIGFYNPFQQYFQEIEELGIIVEDWNNTSKKIAAEEETVTFIPTVDLFDDTDVELFAEDHFHPNDFGYQRIAQRVLDYITNDEG
ncbi:SGNH/GDSL hydrolase family protein [Virgibacillus ainsalahensis]